MYFYFLLSGQSLLFTHSSGPGRLMGGRLERICQKMPFATADTFSTAKGSGVVRDDKCHWNMATMRLLCDFESHSNSYTF